MQTKLTQVCPFLSTQEKHVYCFEECALYTVTEIDEDTALSTCSIAKIAELLNQRLPE